MQVGNITYPKILGLNNQLLGVSNNALTFVNQPTAIQSVSGTANEITASTTNETVFLSLPSQVNLTNLDVSNNLIVGNITYPKILGSNAQILAVENGSLAFVNQQSSSNTINSTTLQVTQTAQNTDIELKPETTISGTNNCYVNLTNNVPVGLNQMNIHSNLGTTQSEPTKVLTAYQSDTEAQTSYPSLNLNVSGPFGSGLYTYTNNDAQNDQFASYTNSKVYMRNGLFDCSIDNVNGLLLNFDSGQQTQLTSYINNTGAKFAGTLNVNNEYIMPQTLGVQGNAIVCDGSNQLVFGNVEPVKNNLIYYGMQWNIQGNAIYQFDTITAAISNVYLYAIGKERRISILLPNQMYFGQNAEAFITQTCPNVDILYWPQDEVAQAATYVQRNVGLYSCMMSSNTVSFTDSFSGNYMSNNPTVCLSFSRASVESLLFDLTVKVIYPQMVFNAVQSQMFYGPMGNEFNGGNEQYMLVVQAGTLVPGYTDNMQSFVY